MRTQFSSFRRLSLIATTVLCLVSVSPALAGGGYTSSGSRALADSNDDGDLLLAGDSKILIRRGQREMAVAIGKVSKGEPSVVTGALLQRDELSAGVDETPATRAVLCVEQQLIRLSLPEEGTPRTERSSLKDALKLDGTRDLRCAVNRKSGEWLAVNIRTGDALLERGKAFKMPEISSVWSHAVHLSSGFFVFGSQGSAVLVRDDAADLSGQPVLSYVKSPWQDLQNRDTLAVRDTTILRTGENQVSLVTLLQDGLLPSWTDVRKIGVNPCSELGGCGAWIGPDQRWIVAGAWGTYVGRGINFSRIKTPLLNSDATTPGVALLPQQQRYLLVGDIDSDIGILPQEALLPRFEFTEKREAQRFSSGLRARRHFVWLKGKNAAPGQTLSVSNRTQTLFTYHPHSSPLSPVGDVILHEGPLPSKWPSDWAAVEGEVEFDALQLNSQWSPMHAAGVKTLPEPKPAWWSDSVQFKKALQLIGKNNLNPTLIRVAVIDSGVDTNHPALMDIFDHNRGEIPANGIDDDGNGLVDDDIGYDFVLEQPEPSDLFGHGTHVAGLLSNAWSPRASLGGAFNGRLRIFRALDGNGKSNSIDLARALSAAIKSKADIVNCSWGGGPETQALRDAFAAAMNAGLIVFSSAGNDGLNINENPPVPKRFPGIISIGASTPSKSRARFSNWGSKAVFLFAPGTDITSTLPEGQMGEKSGTSMASPIAASVGTLVLGLIREKHPEWSTEQQKNELFQLLCTAAEKNHLAGTHSKCGLLNAFSTVNHFLGGS